ncbi:MAG: glycosyltransferase [Gemmata sp.]
MNVTVAICTWNRAALLDQTLRGLRALHAPAGVRWDVLVVNNNSTDETERVLDAHASALPLRRAFEPQPGLSNARNRALASTAADWVVWTDDDVLVSAGWLAAFVETARRRPDAAAVGGPIDPWFQADPDPDLAAVFEPLRTGFCGVNHGPSERDLGPSEYIYGANMAYRRGAVAGLRFDPQLGHIGANQAGGDDVVYLNAARARGPVVWCPGMQVRHYVDPKRMTLDYLARFYRDANRTAILVAPPPDPSPRLFGVPRWVLRRYAVAVARCWALRLLGRRRARLSALRDTWAFGGRIAGYRALAGRPAP